MRPTSKLNILIVYILLPITSLLVGCSPNQSNAGDGRIVFQAYRDGKFDLYIMDPDGSKQMRLTNSVIDEQNFVSNTKPVASPDGKKVAFELVKNGDIDIYVIDIDSGLQVNLTRNDAKDYSPVWSRDGQYIAFVSERDAIPLDENLRDWTNDIYIMDANGSNVHRLTSQNMTNSYSNLSWSPDGKKLIFCMTKKSPYGLVYFAGINVLTLSDSVITPVVFDLSIIQCHPQWSPDGKRIVYTVKASQASEIYIANSDGTGQVALSMGPSSRDTEPSWSPDGKQIVFSSIQNDEYHIYIMDASGTNRVQLTNGPGDERSPTWLPSPAH